MGREFSTNNELNSDYIQQNQFNLILCYSLGKFMWSIGVGWAVYACSTGRGGNG